MERLYTFVVSISNVAGKSFNGKITAKIDFSFEYFTVADADIGSLKSLHILFDKYLNHVVVKFEQNRMVRTIQNLRVFFFFLTKC